MSLISLTQLPKALGRQEFRNCPCKANKRPACGTGQLGDERHLLVATRRDGTNIEMRIGRCAVRQSLHRCSDRRCISQAATCRTQSNFWLSAGVSSDASRAHTAKRHCSASRQAIRLTLSSIHRTCNSHCSPVQTAELISLFSTV